MIRDSYCIWSYKFTIGELKEMIKEAEGDDKETLGMILEESQDKPDETHIVIETGDECSVRWVDGDGSELDIEFDPYIIDLTSFLNNWHSDSGVTWS